MSTEPLIVAEAVGYSAGGQELLRNIDFTVTPGRILTVIGPNGAGKTTLVKLALGLLRPDHGRIRRRQRLRIGYMPQKLTLSESMPLRVERFLALAERERVKIHASAAETGVVHLLQRPMQALSGGELQRVLLARALLGSPQLLVLDEPVQGIDVNGQAEFYRLIVHLRDRLGCAVVMVSHDLHLVMAATDEVLCINRHLCCSGHPDAVSQHPAYLDLFGAVDAKTLAIYTHHHDHEHDLHGNVVPAQGDERHG
jgi:zinc transport system ATP-binding protein